MALADELLDSISEEQFAEYMLVEENPHIVIDEDRNIILPERYKIIAAQGDHDMTTYTFDCPRFSDGRDMSKMVVYINYIRSDGETGSYPADNVSIDAQNNDLMHFEWKPLLPATIEHGAFAFLVCVCRTEPDGSVKNHWSTRLCKDATISEGMDCHKDTIINMYPDVITRILERLNVLEDGGTTSVQYTVQDLEEEQKVQARKNIEAADAKEVSKLSEEIDNIIINGLNQLNFETSVYGFSLDTNTGELVENEIYATSDFIDISEYQGYYLTSNQQPSYVCFYDESKNKIPNTWTANTLYSNNRRIEQSYNAKYIRFTSSKKEHDITMLIFTTEKQTSTPSFSPYGKYLSEEIKISHFFKGDIVSNAGKNEETISIGSGACKNKQSASIAIGSNSLSSLKESTADSDDGKYNTAIGHHTMKNATTSDHCTAVGWSALSDITSGDGNTAVGEDSMLHMTSGNGNVAIGNRAMQANVSGDNNTAIGSSAMYYPDNVPSGDGNTSIGYGAGHTNGKGDFNTCVGYWTKTSNGVSNAIAIGNNVTATEDNMIIIGNDNSEKIILGGKTIIFNPDGTVTWQ